MLEYREAPLYELPGVNVFLLLGQRDGVGYPIGSAVAIAPGLAISAWHVFRAFYDLLQPGEFTFEGRTGLRGNQKAFWKPKFVTEAIYFTGYGCPGIRFIVDLISVSPFSDLVLLRLKPSVTHPEFKFSFRPMQAVPPAAGNWVDAFGYVSEKLRKQKFSTRSYGTRGQIKDVLLNGRDSGSLYFPVFQTNAHFASGMSGGPVFTEKGQLCGLICYMLGDDLDNVGAENISYATALFPLLGCKTELDLPGEPLGAAYTLQELCRRGVVMMDGHDLFELHCDEDGWVIELEAKPRRVNSRP